jgi:hypothetical protein
MKRVLILASLGLFALLVGSTAARAEALTNTTASYAYSGWVPCANGGAGELLTGTIDARILETSTSNGSVDASRFAYALHGSLVGRVTGDVYRLSAITRGTYVTRLESDKYSATYVNRYHLIGPGTGNDLVVRETAHVTRFGDDVVIDRDEFSIECS